MNSWYKRFGSRALKLLLRGGIVTAGLLLSTPAQAGSGQDQHSGAIDGASGWQEPRPCEPNTVYGPPMCGSDQQCEEENGKGWYCNKENSYGDGCGGKIVWPVCEQKPLQPTPKVDSPPEQDPDDGEEVKDIYGPPPPTVYGPPPTELK